MSLPTMDGLSLRSTLQRKDIPPVMLLLGDQSWTAARVLERIRSETFGGESNSDGTSRQWNEERFSAGEAPIGKVIEALKTLSLFGGTRLVLLRGIDHWDGAKGKAASKAESGETSQSAEPNWRDASPLDALADYAKAPVPGSVLVLTANKLNAQRRLMKVLKEKGAIVDCGPPRHQDLVPLVRDLARDSKLGHGMEAAAAEHLVELVGGELGLLADAVDRVMLYAADPKAPRAASVDDVRAVVARIPQSTAWAMTDALLKGAVGEALALVGEVYEPREGGLKLLGAMTWTIRQLTRFESALRAGESPESAARISSVPPFKVQDLSRVVRKLPVGATAKMLAALARADIDMKSSRLDDRLRLDALLLELGAAVARPQSS